MRLSTTIVLVCFFLALGCFLLIQEKEQAELSLIDAISERRYEVMKESYFAQHRKEYHRVISRLKQEGCQSFVLGFGEQVCDSRALSFCVREMKPYDFMKTPFCVDYGHERIETPASVKGIYMSSRAAGYTPLRGTLINLAKTTEINTVVIDIKEVDGYTGTIVGDKAQFPFQEDLMGDVRSLITELHKHGIYAIARIALFKDMAWAEAHPNQAVQKKNARGTAWTDRQGKKFVDPSAEEFWDYLVELSSASYQLGFDEIQADYIRFPSDGDMKNTYYPHSKTYLDEMGAEEGRIYAMGQFMDYYTSALRKRHPDIVLSADVFGMVTSLDNDLTIGQTLEPYLQYFDYVSPMIYPSHYARGFVDLPGHPDNHPYEVVRKAMDDGIEKARVAGYEADRIRPWIQDFTCTWCPGYFAYGPSEIREQIDAIYESGATGWLLWNAANRYTAEALERQ